MKITIRKNDYDEYEVPTQFRDRGSLPKKPCAIYYTDDKDDAIGTAQMILGADVVCTFKRGTYSID